MEHVLNLLPLAIIFVMLAIFLRLSFSRSTANMNRAIASNDEIVEVTKAVAAELREIKEILKDRKI